MKKKFLFLSVFFLIAISAIVVWTILVIIPIETINSLDSENLSVFVYRIRYEMAIVRSVKTSPVGVTPRLPIIDSDAFHIDLLLDLIWKYSRNGNAQEKDWAARLLIALLADDFSKYVVPDIEVLSGATDWLLTRKYESPKNEQEKLAASIFLRQRKSQRAIDFVKKNNIPELQDLTKRAREIDPRPYIE